ncbi:MAG: membrane protein insertase YidC [Alphaproteobacteria bacterium]|nr:membrane protein insertase YidC [Alphaproteobacteria bacterium]
MDQKNLIIAIALSVAILLGWNIFVETPQMQREAELAQQAEMARPQGNAVGPPVPGAAVRGTGAVATPPREQVLAQSRRVKIATPALSGSVDLDGGRIDDLTLLRKQVTAAPDSPDVTLLAPPGTANPYYVEYGWVDEADHSFGLGDAQWQSAGGTLTPSSPLTLTLDNGAGLLFTRTIAVDDHYLFTVTDRVTNRGSETAKLFPFGRVRRIGTPETLGYFVLHEGPIGMLGGVLQEPNYDNVVDDRTREYASTGGWIGFTDIYWLVALIPDQQAAVDAAFRHTVEGGVDRYQADMRGGWQSISPGYSAEVTHRLFAGAKHVQLLDAYRDNHGIERFDRAIDFGWFFFLTKPFLHFLLWLTDYLGNIGLAILALTVLVKLAFFPLANKSYRSMSKMKALQPKMMELREKYGADRQKMQQELMGLYRREKVNPVSGCLPIVIQIPVFFALYKIILISIEVRHAPFYGWIRDLSSVDPTNLFTLFGLVPWSPPSLLHIGIWPIVMGITMFAQMKLNPAPADPIQAKMFTFMPLIFTFFLASFPSALVIYWTWNNLLSIAQQYLIMRSMGVAIGGGTTPPPPKPGGGKTG